MTKEYIGNGTYKFTKDDNQTFILSEEELEELKNEKKEHCKENEQQTIKY